ncbi:hypothetical protein E9993_01715 [Labilibacter sediminis]|nr:hypothetical protein E9993_01715 [Labilibacter sediminis]
MKTKENLKNGKPFRANVMYTATEEKKNYNYTNKHVSMIECLDVSVYSRLILIFTINNSIIPKTKIVRMLTKTAISKILSIDIKTVNKSFDQMIKAGYIEGYGENFTININPIEDRINELKDEYIIDQLKKCNISSTANIMMEQKDIKIFQKLEKLIKNDLADEEDIKEYEELKNIYNISSYSEYVSRNNEETEENDTTTPTNDLRPVNVAKNDDKSILNVVNSIGIEESETPTNDKIIVKPNKMSTIYNVLANHHYHLPKYRNNYSEIEFVTLYMLLEMNKKKGDFDTSVENINTKIKNNENIFSQCKELENFKKTVGEGKLKNAISFIESRLN